MSHQRRISVIGDEASGEMIEGAYYAFGANNLHIGRGLLRVLEYLEKNYGLDLNKEPAEDS